MRYRDAKKKEHDNWIVKIVNSAQFAKTHHGLIKPAYISFLENIGIDIDLDTDFVMVHDPLGTLDNYKKALASSGSALDSQSKELSEKLAEVEELKQQLKTMVEKPLEIDETGNAAE